jgi:ribosomal protein S17
MATKLNKSVEEKPDGYETAEVESLHLDSRNPRLVQYGLKLDAGEPEIVRLLKDQMDVEEVAMSIAASGYWDHEPLFVVTEKGKDVVIEGNRRLAAVKLLRDVKLRDKLKASTLPKISEKSREALGRLPIIRIKKRQDIWRYLGFKHVNGPAKWSSYAKAQYIAFVRNSTGESLQSIADQIGDKHNSVQRLYRSLMVIEQAERGKVYSRRYVYKKRLAFSHMTTGLDYEGFAAFLRLSDEGDESPSPVHKSRIKELGELCRWLWGDSRDETPPVIESQNPDLRQLANVLLYPDALSTLRATGNLSEAFEVTKGDDVAFAECPPDSRVKSTFLSSDIRSPKWRLIYTTLC